MSGLAGTNLPAWERTLVVVAHPDDESFGLGAVIDEFVTTGSRVHVLCLTHGEASTLGEIDDLAGVRAREFATAAAALGVQSSTLLAHPDGGLANLDLSRLAADVTAAIIEHDADGLLVFDPSGITGHPDHVTATLAAVEAAIVHDLRVLAWTLPEHVARALTAEFGATFHGHSEAEIDLLVRVSRARQREACGAHASQTPPGAPLWRRLDLLGVTEALRWLPSRTA